MKNEEITEFCIYCGAHIPKREGEGTCPKCDPPKKTYKIYGLTIEVEDGSGQILEGTLKKTCPCCFLADCTCQFFPNARSYDEKHHTDCLMRERYNLTMNGLEVMLVTLATEGIDIGQPAFEAAIQEAKDSTECEY